MNVNEDGSFKIPNVPMSLSEGVVLSSFQETLHG